MSLFSFLPSSIQPEREFKMQIWPCHPHSQSLKVTFPCSPTPTSSSATSGSYIDPILVYNSVCAYAIPSTQSSLLHPSWTTWKTPLHPSKPPSEFFQSMLNHDEKQFIFFPHVLSQILKGKFHPLNVLKKKLQPSFHLSQALPLKEGKVLPAGWEDKSLIPIGSYCECQHEWLEGWKLGASYLPQQLSHWRCDL